MQGLDGLYLCCHGTLALRMSQWDSLETMFKIRLTELVFKSIKGYSVTEFKDLILQRNSGRRRNDNIILLRPETNLIRNSIRYRAIVWNSLTNKEIRDKTLKEFKLCLDAYKMNFEPILTILQLKSEISVTNILNSFSFFIVHLLSVLVIFLVIVACTTPPAMLIFLSC